MLTPKQLAVLAWICLPIFGCQNYSTPYLDAQGDLSRKFQRGEISKAEYEAALSRQRGTKPLGGPEPRPPASIKFESWTDK